MTLHDALLAVQAAVEHLRGGEELYEAIVMHEVCEGERQETLSVTVHRFLPRWMTEQHEDDDD